jgi:ketosteroid isomerase-like protein
VAVPDSEYSARSIENLIATYAALIDAGDFAGLGDLFAEAVFGGEGDAVVRGAESVEKLFRTMVRVYEDGTPRTKHVTTNIRIDVDDAAGTAVAHSYVTVFQALPDLPLQPIVAGRYRDVFERRADAWRFVERRFTTDLVGDVSHHLLVGPDVLAR